MCFSQNLAQNYDDHYSIHSDVEECLGPSDFEAWTDGPEQDAWHGHKVSQDHDNRYERSIVSGWSVDSRLCQDICFERGEPQAKHVIEKRSCETASQGHLCESFLCYGGVSHEIPDWVAPG